MFIRPLALACALGVPSVASANVFFTFDDPATGNEVSGTIGSPSFITYDLSQPVTLVVDGSEEPGVTSSEVQATLNMNFSLGAPLRSGPMTMASVQGSFEFVVAEPGPNQGEVILSATLDGGQLFLFAGAGSVVTTAMVEGGDLAYTPGPFLNNLGIDQLFAIDAVFTLTDIIFDELEPVAENPAGEEVINSFTANAAFTATAFIPSPGAIALFGTAIGATLFRRRRSA